MYLTVNQLQPVSERASAVESAAGGASASVAAARPPRTPGVAARPSAGGRAGQSAGNGDARDTTSAADARVDRIFDEMERFMLGAEGVLSGASNGGGGAADAPHDTYPLPLLSASSEATSSSSSDTRDLVAYSNSSSDDDDVNTELAGVADHDGVVATDGEGGARAAGDGAEGGTASDDIRVRGSSAVGGDGALTDFARSDDTITTETVHLDWDALRSANRSLLSAVTTRASTAVLEESRATLRREIVAASRSSGGGLGSISLNLTDDEIEASVDLILSDRARPGASDAAERSREEVEDTPHPGDTSLDSAAQEAMEAAALQLEGERMLSTFGDYDAVGADAPTMPAQLSAPLQAAQETVADLVARARAAALQSGDALRARSDAMRARRSNPATGGAHTVRAADLSERQRQRLLLNFVRLEDHGVSYSIDFTSMERRELRTGMRTRLRRVHFDLPAPGGVAADADAAAAAFADAAAAAPSRSAAPPHATRAQRDAASSQQTALDASWLVS